MHHSTSLEQFTVGKRAKIQGFFRPFHEPIVKYVPYIPARLSPPFAAAAAKPNETFSCNDAKKDTAKRRCLFIAILRTWA
jgi:hypothetical protein